MAENGVHQNVPRMPGKETLERPLPKRFYDAADVKASGDDWAIILDGRSVRTPGRHPLIASTRMLAAAIAQEWAAQVEVIDPGKMPLTRIMNTGLDGVAGKEAEVYSEIVNFAGSDLLCYRAQHPQELVNRQVGAWDHPLEWLKTTHGVELLVGSGIMPIVQPAAALRLFGQLIKRDDPLRLAAMHGLVSLSGSAVLALAVAEGFLTPEEGWRAAHIDEDWQIEQWGGDDEAEARRAYRWGEFSAAARFLRLLQ